MYMNIKKAIQKAMRAEKLKRVGCAAFLIFSFSHFLISTAAAQGAAGSTQASAATAQDTAPQAFKFGYLSYEAVLQSAAGYAQAQESIRQLREHYEAEMTSAENDFNKKYEEFLDGQSSYPKTILMKRQSELQELLNRNIAFKKEGLVQLAKAEAEALAPLKARLAEALAVVGQSLQLAFILNTDEGAIPWLNVAVGIDVTEDVKANMGQ